MIYFTDNFKEICEKWKKYPEKFANALSLGLKEGLFKYEAHLQKEQLSGRKTENYGLKVQSGIARESLNVVMSREGEDILGKIAVGKNAWYLKLHEHYQFNGYALAKGGTCFVVPIHPSAKGRKPIDFQLVYIKRPGKSPLLIRQIRIGGSTKVAGALREIQREDIMYVLTKKIYIPKRTYFYEEFPTIGDRFIRERIEKNLERVANED